MKTLRCFPPMVSSCCPLYSSPRTTLFFRMWFSRMILSNLWSMDITSAARKTVCLHLVRHKAKTVWLDSKFLSRQSRQILDDCCVLSPTLNDHCCQFKRVKETKMQENKETYLWKRCWGERARYIQLLVSLQQKGPTQPPCHQRLTGSFPTVPSPV